MKNLASLTTFFATFLFVVYLGVFAGLRINTLISSKKVITVTPLASVTTQSTPTPTSTPTLKPAPSASLVPQTKLVVSAPAVAAPVDTPTPPPAAPPPVDTPPPAPPLPPSNKCIITLSGGSYDVTDFRNIHSGGDVFQCGTDMTAIFLSRHPASFLQKMAQYKV